MLAGYLVDRQGSGIASTHSAALYSQREQKLGTFRGFGAGLRNGWG